MKNIVKTLSIIGLCILWLQTTYTQSEYKSFFTNTLSQSVQVTFTILDGFKKTVQINPQESYELSLPVDICMTSVRMETKDKKPHLFAPGSPCRESMEYTVALNARGDLSIRGEPSKKSYFIYRD